LELLESVAVICALASVVLLWFEHSGTYPLTIAGAFLYMYICYTSGIYADIAINACFAVTSAWGWIVWRRNKGEPGFAVEFLKPEQLAGYAGAVVGLTVVISFLLRRYTDSTVYIADALTTSLGLVAQVLVIRKKIENWYFWMAANVVCVPLYYSKGLYPSAALWAIMFFFSLSGLLLWLRKYRCEQALSHSGG
jgi:nicotinamide mononucleotide transporter